MSFSAFMIAHINGTSSDSVTEITSKSTYTSPPTSTTDNAVASSSKAAEVDRAFTLIAPAAPRKAVLSSTSKTTSPTRTTSSSEVTSHSKAKSSSKAAQVDRAFTLILPPVPKESKEVPTRRREGPTPESKAAHSVFVTIHHLLYDVRTELTTMENSLSTASEYDADDDHPTYDDTLPESMSLPSSRSTSISTSRNSIFTLRSISTNTTTPPTPSSRGSTTSIATNDSGIGSPLPAINETALFTLRQSITLGLSLINQHMAFPGLEKLREALITRFMELGEGIDEVERTWREWCAAREKAIAYRLKMKKSRSRTTLGSMGEEDGTKGLRASFKRMSVRSGR